MRFLGAQIEEVGVRRYWFRQMKYACFESWGDFIWWDTLRGPWLLCGWGRSLVIWSTHHYSHHVGEVPMANTVAILVSWFSIIVRDLMLIGLLKHGEAFLGATMIFLYDGGTARWSDHACKDDVMRPSSTESNLPESCGDMHSFLGSFSCCFDWFFFVSKALTDFNPWTPLKSCPERFSNSWFFYIFIVFFNKCIW